MSTENLEICEENLVVKCLQVVFRHGARTPIRPLTGIDEVEYEKEILMPPSQLNFTTLTVATDGSPVTELPLENNYKGIYFKGGAPAGQLTDIGRLQCCFLGVQLGGKYRSLFTQAFNSSNIWLSSSPLNRCICSLRSVLAGAFSDNLESLDNIMIWVDCHKTKMIPDIFNCPRYKYVSVIMQGKMENDHDYAQLIEHLKNHFGIMMDDPYFSVTNIHDHVCSRKVHCLPVPGKLLEVLPQLEKFATEELLISSGGRFDQTKNGLKLGMGRLVNTLARNFEQIGMGKHDDQLKHPSTYLFSGHDSTLAALLEILGSPIKKCPDFASCITLELLEDSKNCYWVKASYNFEALLLRGCSQTIITLEEFLKVLGPFRINDEDHMNLCQSQDI